MDEKDKEFNRLRAALLSNPKLIEILLKTDEPTLLEYMGEKTPTTSNGQIELMQKFIVRYIDHLIYTFPGML